MSINLPSKQIPEDLSLSRDNPDNRVAKLIQEFLFLFYSDETYQANDLLNLLKAKQNDEPLVKEFLSQSREVQMLTEELAAVEQFLKDLSEIKSEKNKNSSKD